MKSQLAQTSPRTLARVGGLLYVIIIAGGAFGEAFIRGTLIVVDDPVATAERIRASEFLWRMGAAGEFVMLVLSVCLAVILYRLLEPVSRDLALLALLFNLLAIGIEAVNEINLLEAVSLTTNAEFLAGLAPGQSETLAHLPISAYGDGWAVGLIFFGVELVILGHLISRAGYLPRTLGVMLQIGGLSYLTNSFALIISPSLAALLLPMILVPVFLAELSAAMWLLAKGVDERKWEELVNVELPSPRFAGALR